MEIKKLNNNTCWCSVCDARTAKWEISHNGSLKLFWAHNPSDPELALCDSCMEKLKRLINEIDLEMEEDNVY